MKKAGVLLLVFFLTLVIVSAQNESVEEKAYSCLESKVKDKCSSLSLEEQAFSLLALSYNSKIQNECKSALKDKGEDEECWPKDSCKIKDTSLAILALNPLKNTEKAESWLLSKNTTPDKLEWHLEIDVAGESKCTLKYDTTSKTITLKEDKKISGDAGNCFSPAYDNYWLKIENSCLGKKFSVSCDKDFISTLLYKKSNSNIWHVSSDTKTASAQGATEHEINSYCFSASASCNYEENLFAVLALSKAGHDISSFLPYLVVFADENKKYFPDSFLYIFTNSEDALKEMLNSQKKQGYWDFSGNKFYDTALALLALPKEASSTPKEWLKEVQDKDGCWNSGNTRDTSFLLWAAFPKEAAVQAGEIPNCEPTYHCTTQGECDEVGDVLRNYYCPGLKICCDKPKKEKTCEESKGKTCEDYEECSVATILTSDEPNCCPEDCEPKKSECEEIGYFCKTSCSEDEEAASLDCPLEQTCCKEKIAEAKSYWWIWLLVILIILVILGIIFRNKLRVLIFKWKGGFKLGDVTKTRPSFPPPGAGLRRMFPIPGAIQKPIARIGTKTDRELEETLKKLKEMSK